MADSSRHGPYPAHSDNRNHTLASLQFTTAAGADPVAANNVDPCGLISPVTAVKRTATGTIVVTLRKTYKQILAIAGVGGTAGEKATVSATDGTTITVKTYAAGGSAAADLTATPITLNLHLFGSAS